jgi:hypothetical protein
VMRRREREQSSCPLFRLSSRLFLLISFSFDYDSFLTRLRSLRFGSLRFIESRALTRPTTNHPTLTFHSLSPPRDTPSSLSHHISTATFVTSARCPPSSCDAHPTHTLATVKSPSTSSPNDELLQIKGKDSARARQEYPRGHRALGRSEHGRRGTEEGQLREPERDGPGGGG